MATGPADAASISVIVPAFNDSQTLSKCLAAIAASDLEALECLVADDGSTEDIGLVARGFGARVIRVGDSPSGPARARNVGAAAAIGDILVFVDADVVIRPETLRLVASTFTAHPDIDAVFGSYDDEPATPDFVSQFKNLFHHFVHQEASAEAGTFWSGCGAVRRSVFNASGGFDEQRYTRPCIEDIELGYRLRASGHRIMLNRDIQVKHLKRWTLRGMVRTDIFDRGVPWTRLILESRSLPNALNLHFMQRLSAMLAYSMLLYVALVAFFHNVVLLPLVAGLFLIVVGAMNWSNDGPLFSMSSRRSELIALSLIGVIAFSALALGSTRMIPPLALLFLGMLGGRWLTPLSQRGKRILFPIVIGALVTSIALLLSSFSVVVAAPLLGAASLIVLLNHRLYVFFARKRGLTFALAALPMHLLYYSYTLIALTLGGLAFLAGGRRSRVPAKVA